MNKRRNTMELTETAIRKLEQALAEFKAKVIQQADMAREVNEDSDTPMEYDALDLDIAGLVMKQVKIIKNLEVDFSE
jgi:hypothetical protein